MTQAQARVYAVDGAGVRRLVAAPGDEIPTGVEVAPLVTTQRQDPAPRQAPLTGYDDLTEDEILELLPELDDEQLEVVRSYEAAGEARGSIVNYEVAAVVVDAGKDDTAAEREVPAVSVTQGYDALKLAQLQEEADKRELSVSGTGANGNVTKSDLVAALIADDAAKKD